MRKLQKRNNLDELPVVKYIRRMMNKAIITPEEYEKGKKASDHLEALRKREILRLANEEGWEQREIAEHFGISESYVSRIIRGER